MMKLDIWPAFINTSSFELKKEETDWTFIFAKDAYAHIQDSGKIWVQPRFQHPAIDPILALANQIIEQPTPDKRLILDGVSLRLRLMRDGKELLQPFRCPFSDSPEFHLVQQLLQMATETFQDSAAINYIELLETYFFDVVPIKEFDESPYRIKVYGRWTSSEETLLSEKFATLQQKSQSVVDMTNFQGTGRALNPVFKQLERIPGLVVWVNQIAKEYLEEIGFDATRIELREA